MNRKTFLALNLCPNVVENENSLIKGTFNRIFMFSAADALSFFLTQNSVRVRKLSSSATAI
jgi:hypothetical protein